MKTNIIARKLDGFVIKVKVKDAETFFADNGAYEKLMLGIRKAKKKPCCILENPRYYKFEEETEKNNYSYAHAQLKQRGFNVELPKEFYPEDTFSYYIIKSKPAIRRCEKRHEGFQSFLFSVFDTIKALSVCREYRSLFNKSDRDIYVKEASNLLYNYQMNKLENQRFQKTIKNLNLRELTFPFKETK